jgi:hypothetical protein
VAAATIEAGPPAAAAAPWSDAPDSKAPAAAIVPPPPSSSMAPASALAATAAAPPDDPGVSATAPPTAPTAAAIPDLTPPHDDPAIRPAGLAPNADSWPELSRQLALLEVTHYWVEGQPGGAVRFRCALAVSGEGTVTRQFEAEGDDLTAAAGTVLRRVALWQAAHAGEP